LAKSEKSLAQRQAELNAQRSDIRQVEETLFKVGSS
jgi:hypothetical protein